MADTVVVACKLPNGLQVHLGRVVEPVDKGTRDAQMVVKNEGKRITFNGEHSKGSENGFGFTLGVDRAAFEAWEKDHRDFPPVKNLIIFAMPTLAEAKARAADFGLLKTGFEPLNFDDPNGDGSIKPDDQMKNVKQAEAKK